MSALRSFSINRNHQGDKIQVQISETPGLQAENLSLATWGSSFVLANLLYRWTGNAHGYLSSLSDGTKCLAALELGAGTSLVGISAAAIWSLPVVVTDLPSLVPGLTDNIAVNHELLQHSGALVKSGTLDWSKPDVLQLADDALYWPKPNNFDHQSSIHAVETKAHILLAADTVYAEDHPELLCKTITTWLAPRQESRVIFCYVLRHSYIDIIRDLWERLEQLGLECIEEGQQDADPDRWDDVAPFEWCVWAWKHSDDDATCDSQ